MGLDFSAQSHGNARSLVGFLVTASSQLSFTPRKIPSEGVGMGIAFAIELN